MTQDPSSPARWWDANATRLFLCGVAALFWELVLIRWLGASIRIVAYFSNLVLISAFFGLGVGALATRFPVRLERLIAPLTAFVVMLGVWLGPLWHSNPTGVTSTSGSGLPWALPLRAGRRPASSRRASSSCSCTAPPPRCSPPSASTSGGCSGLTLRFVPTASRWPGACSASPSSRSCPTGRPRPRRGSASALSSWFSCCPVAFRTSLAGVLGAFVVVATQAESQSYLWSPYYRISVDPLTRVTDLGTRQPVEFEQPIGEVLTVNNDYHQMMLDLQPRPKEHDFLAGWRSFYDAPYGRYARIGDLPPGDVLVVGAGTGNDVAAALRQTDRRVTAVEIDPAIADLGPPPARREALLGSPRHPRHRRRPLLLQPVSGRAVRPGGLRLPRQPPPPVRVLLGPARQLHLHPRGDEGGAPDAGPGGACRAQLREQRTVDPRAPSRPPRPRFRASYVGHRRPAPVRQRPALHERALRRPGRGPRAPGHRAHRRLAVPLPPRSTHPRSQPALPARGGVDERDRPPDPPPRRAARAVPLLLPRGGVLPARDQQRGADGAALRLDVVGQHRGLRRHPGPGPPEQPHRRAMEESRSAAAWSRSPP